MQTNRNWAATLCAALNRPELEIRAATDDAAYDYLNRPKIIGGRMDWIRQLCLIRLFGDSTPLQILLAECSRWNSAAGAG